jgi:hypothetical protein
VMEGDRPTVSAAMMRKGVYTRWRPETAGKVRTA